MSSAHRSPGWWGGGRATAASEWCKQHYGWTCWLCGHEIAEGDYSVDHIIERRVRPDLTWEPSNWRPAHRTKKPAWGCPGNAGRSAQKQAESPVTQTWSAPGW